MPNIERQRTTLRKSISKAANKIQELVGKEEFEKDVLIAQFELLKLRFEELCQHDVQAIEKLYEGKNVKDKDIESEQDKIDTYTALFYKCKIMVESAVQESTTETSTTVSNVTESSKHRYKLPALKLKEFNGDLKDWLPFWSQFQKIHDDVDLDDADKLSYLSMSMTMGSSARQLVDSYPATKAMYPAIIQALKDRFGRADLLTELYIRELLSLVLQNTVSKEKSNISVLYDKLQSHLRNLESLDVTINSCAPILMPLVSSCLSPDLLQLWERSISNKSLTSSKEFLENLMEFLKLEVESQQKLKLAQSTFGLTKDTSTIPNRHQSHNKETKQERFATAAGLVNSINPRGEKDSCLFCGNNHNTHDCHRASNMSLTERQDIVREKQACFRCLKIGHKSSMCRSNVRCKDCGGRHAHAICNTVRDSTSHHSKGTLSFKNNKSSATGVNSTCEENLASSTEFCNVLMHTLIVNVHGKNDSIKQVRLLIDTGSQRSYLLNSTASELGLNSIKKESIQHILFGGSSTGAIEHDVYKLHISSLDNTYRCNFDVLSQRKICGGIPVVSEGPWLEELDLHNIKICDFQSDQPEINILVGADVAAKLWTGRLVELSTGLVAMQTKLGWTLSGKIPSEPGQSSDSSGNIATVVTDLFVKEAPISDLWSLDVLGIRDPMEQTRSDLAKAAQKHFLDTVQINEDNRFEVHLPWIEGHPPLASNLKMSQKRLESTTKKLNREKYYSDYQKVLDTWEGDKIIERVPQEELDKPAYYMPHHPVIKLGSTTPVRPVFDASARDNGVSLNDCLERGPNLIETVSTSLAKFRRNKIGVSSDIAKAFLQISVSPKDRDYLRFLWQSENGPLITYRHCRVVFGVSSSPFLLESCLKLHLEETLKLSREGKLDLPTSVLEMMIDSFYVDNCLVSVHDEKEAKEFVKVATFVMNLRGFELRGWELTGDKDDKPSNVLGLMWDRSNDTLAIKIERLTSMNLEKITKKVMLSAAHSIFDPIGIISSFTLVPKILLQKTWETGLAWNDEVDEDTRTKFKQWMSEVPLIAEVRIPRWVGGPNITNHESLSLHAFSDASKSAYAAAIFIRLELETEVSVHLLASRARVAPTSRSKKGMTIPRLELMAACIATRLLKTVVDDFKLSDVKTTFWTDATTVLAWIKRNEPWNIFVMNRITEIRRLSTGHEWKHVPGTMNPADLPSRGCTMSKLLQCRWWEGPVWLRDSPDNWPQPSTNVDEKEVGEELKKIVSSMTNTTQSTSDSWYYAYFSNYKKLVRSVAWVYRFYTNCKAKRQDRILGELSAVEYDTAERKVLLWIQQETFIEDDPRLSSLVTFIDKNGLIRIKTKISNREDHEEFCCPIVLPRHPVVLRLIMFYHLNNCHAGTQILLSILRQRFWILGGRKTIQSVTKTCLICKRHTVRRMETVPTPLPKDRVRDAAVFEVTGIDLAGPLFIKGENGQTRKVWICLFTCAIYRAVRLELVSSLSTDSFLQALRRFCNRQGRPKVVYSDNGTNFTGFDNACSKLDWDAIAQYSTAKRITWRFNPPSAPWWGGWFERLIGIMKNLLRRVLGHSSVDYVELETLLSDVESVMNSRPLTYLSSNPQDLVALTPNMFLHELEEDDVPEYDLLQSTDLGKKLQYRHELRKNLRQRFKSEYLGQLKLFADKRKQRDIQLGEIVLIGDDNSKRMDWPLGLVIELIHGRDGNVRVVRVRTKGGVLMRPVQRIFPLELDHVPTKDNDEPAGENVSAPNEYHEVLAPVVDETIPNVSIPVPDISVVGSYDPLPPPTLHLSRHGRHIRKPLRLNI